MSRVQTSVDGTVLRAVDVGENVVELETTGWDEPAPELDPAAPVDATTAGRCRGLTVPWVSVAVAALRTDGSLETVASFGTERKSVDLEDDAYQIELSASITTFIRFDGAATVRRLSDRRGEIAFEQPTAVTVGFRSPVLSPTETITTTRRPEDVAAAVSHWSVALRTTTPDVTRPGYRTHPPELEFGDELSIPEAVRSERPQTGVEVVAPDRLAALLPIAPLAFYLGASVRTADREAPTLRAPERGVEHVFAPLPDGQEELAAMLRRICLLDNVVRSMDGGTDLLEADALALLEEEIAPLVDAEPAERLERYLSLDWDRIEPVFPPWHTRLYVEPEPESLRALPYVMAGLPQVRVITDGAVELPDVPSVPGGTTAADHDPLTPFVGWLGANPPPVAYDASATAFEHSVGYRSTDATGDRVVVVDTGETDADGEQAVAVYESRPEVDVDPEFHEAPSTDELAAVLAEGVDYLHFVGECSDGLACHDGRLRGESLADLQVKLCLLDGPDSAATGRSLVEAGAAAAIVRDGSVRGGLASTVRDTFLRLLTDGFEATRARRYVRRYVDEPSDLRIVGNGLESLAVGDGIYPVVKAVEPLGNRQFGITCQSLFSEVFWRWRADVPDGPIWLVGNYGKYAASDTNVSTLLEPQNNPFLYEEDLYWPARVEEFDPLQ